MDHIELKNQALPIPAKSAYGSQDPFLSHKGTNNDLHLSMNSYPSTTEASGVSTTDLGLSALPHHPSPITAYEFFPNNVMSSNYGHIQDPQAELDSLLPRHGVLCSMTSDRCYPTAGSQQESQPEFFSSWEVEMPNGGPPTHGSQYLHEDEQRQSHWQYNHECDATDFVYSVQERSDTRIESPAYILLNHSHGPETRFSVPQDDPGCRQPWSILSLRETEVPLGATSLDDVPMSGPTIWRLGNLDEPSPNAASKEPLRVPMASEHLKPLTSAGFTFVSAPMPRGPGSVSKDERSLTDLSSQPCWRSRQIAWNAKTGEGVPIRNKRSATRAERTGSRAIRKLGGQCPKCKKGKRKCDRTHIRGSSEASTTSSPLSTPSGLDSSWIMVPPPRQRIVKPIDPVDSRHGDRLLPPSQSCRQSAIYAARPLSADAEPRPEQAVVPGGHEISVPHTRTTTSGNRSTDHLCLNAREDEFSSTAEWPHEALSSAPGRNDWDDTPLTHAYVGLGGQFGSQCSLSWFDPVRHARQNEDDSTLPNIYNVY